MVTGQWARPRTTSAVAFGAVRRGVGVVSASLLAGRRVCRVTGWEQFRASCLNIAAPTRPRAARLARKARRFSRAFQAWRRSSRFGGPPQRQLQAPQIVRAPTRRSVLPPAASHRGAGPAGRAEPAQGAQQRRHLAAAARSVHSSLRVAPQAELRANVFLAINEQDIQQGGAGAAVAAACNRSCQCSCTVPNAPARRLQVWAAGLMRRAGTRCCQTRQVRQPARSAAIRPRSALPALDAAACHRSTCCACRRAADGAAARVPAVVQVRLHPPGARSSGSGERLALQPIGASRRAAACRSG